jgi:hypothetical protein
MAGKIYTKSHLTPSPLHLAFRDHIPIEKIFSPLIPSGRVGEFFSKNFSKV